MHLLTPLLLLLSTTLASPLSQRDISSVLSSFSAVQAEIATLTTSVTDYTGSRTQLPDIISQFNALESSITSTSSSVQNTTGEFNTDESEEIVSAVQNITGPAITLLLDVGSKNATVATAGYTPDVFAALQRLNGETIDLFSALEDKVVSNLVAAITPSQEQIAAAFRDVIADYQ